MASLRERYKRSPSMIKTAITAVLTIWIIATVVVITGCQVVFEEPVAAEPISPDTRSPTISLAPIAGPPDTIVTVYGQGWPPNSTVLLYLEAPEEMGRGGYALGGAVADATGQFKTTLPIPADPRWEAPGLVSVVARTDEGQVSAQALFNLANPPSQPTEIPQTSVEPTVALTPSVPLLALRPQPESPTAIATANVNIRNGPGTAYPVLGALRTGQSAEVTGVSPDNGWWQIKFAGLEDGRGWLSAQFVTAQNVSNVPVVQPPALPPAPTPLVISDWRGEYYNNLTLSGNPTLLRNDTAINFNWETGTPAAGVGADNFSARWTRTVNFSSGTYRFYVYADDGVRLWVDGNLLIDQWHDTSPLTYVADIYLTDGPHSLKMEYYEHIGGALAQLNWERLETYSDWKGEYFSNPSLAGAPVLVRNDANVMFGWGPDSPGPGVPVDNFSARWTRTKHFSAGIYRFRVLVDDGARLWVDGNLLIDRWRTGEPKSYTGEMYLTDGPHSLRLEYFDFRYDAQVYLRWERIGAFSEWKAEYFDNRKLKDKPILVRNEARIDHQWGSGAPAGVPADNFSARWTREDDFDAGTYRFQVKVDDGIRLWLDGDLLIDDWREAGVRQIEAERYISSGGHDLKVEYYERTGEAHIEVKWRKN
jgi:uncharacterized protein YraI